VKTVPQAVVTDESRYYKADWILAEKQASEDYKTGNVKTANSIDEMFDETLGKFNES
jgi:hypothetical protein